MSRTAQPRVRPRYARIAAAGCAFATTLVTLLAATGVLPADAPAASASGGPEAAATATLSSVTTPAGVGGSARESRSEPSPPPDSGTGRRVVFDLGDQRVWLVDEAGDVLSTYLVSGSLTENLHPGTYAVYSRSRWAVGIDDSGVMQYFVRFTRGDHAAIGFHSLPTKHGRPLQTRAQLGTPQSHGCIRQALPDARRLWTFAPVGTKVVVTA